jgi:tetratricopeptide (TPR) repeat protein
MKYQLLLGCIATSMVFAPKVMAKSTAEIEQIARGAAIEVKLQNSPLVGSGVIVHRQGDLYTIVTNRHVVCGNVGARCKALPPTHKYTIGTADGQKYQIEAGAVRFLGKDLDLAILRFRSSKKYVVAPLATADRLKLDDAVYVAGFALEQKGFNFSKGRAIAVVNKRLTDDKGGYTIIYDTFTLPGMSGSGVYNNSGQLVGIHGLGERFLSGTEIDDESRLDSKIGVNRGIPIRWVLQELGKAGILSNSQPSSNQPTALAKATTADEYFTIGFNKWVEPGSNDIKAEKMQAIQDFTTAIKLNPNYAAAYFMRSYIYYQLKEFNKSLADIDKAISIVPNYSRAYNNRGLLKVQLQDLSGALKDLNMAVKFDPTDDIAYLSRGEIKRQTGDKDGALADFNRSIQLNPKRAEAYAGRATLQYLGFSNLPAALVDLDKAIEINPNLAIAYYNRAALKLAQKDFPGALEDMNRTIELSPNLAEAYYSRGLLKRDRLQDRSGAMEDFRRAAQLFQQQGKTQEYNRIMRVLSRMGN